MASEAEIAKARGRWTEWDPYGWPKLEPRTLFMPQQLLAACAPATGDNTPMSIVVQIAGYLEYHLDKGTPEELLVFTRSDFLESLFEACLALDPDVEPDRGAILSPRVKWGRTPEIRAEERNVLLRACVRAFLEAVSLTRSFGLEPLEVVEALVCLVCDEEFFKAIFNVDDPDAQERYIQLYSEWTGDPVESE